MKLYPLKFQPITQYRIWGGHKLNAAVSKELQMDNLGEIWSISGVKDNLSIVQNGDLKGKNISELVQEYKGRLVGEKVWKEFGTHFPLLIKFLDAEADLSVQVHPNDEQAKKLNQSSGKSEMWYIMDAAPNSELIIGFKKGIKKEDYFKNLESETLEKILNKVPVKREDAIYIPAGRVHAIGKGIVLAEIQQTSDITYRIYDYNRIDKDGKKRDLHTSQAAEVINFEPLEEIKTTYSKIENQFNNLIETPYFKTQIYFGNKDFEIIQNTEMRIYVCTHGKAEFVFGTMKINLEKYQSILIPAECVEYQIRSEKGINLIEVKIP